jgi:hypothetical protein
VAINRISLSWSLLRGDAVAGSGTVRCTVQLLR